MAVRATALNVAAQRDSQDGRLGEGFHRPPMMRVESSSVVTATKRGMGSQVIRAHGMTVMANRSAAWERSPWWTHGNSASARIYRGGTGAPRTLAPLRPRKRLATSSAEGGQPEDQRPQASPPAQHPVTALRGYIKRLCTHVQCVTHAWHTRNEIVMAKGNE
jgi:hypothetical protein